MRQYTTPTLNITIRYKNGEIATDLEFEYLVFSLRSECKKIDRIIEKKQVVDGVFTVTFTQEETAKFKIGQSIEMELNFYDNGERFASNIRRMEVSKNLLNEVIGNV